MAQFVRYLVGVAWMLSGALMAFSPPPHDAPRAGQFPAIGAFVMLGGICYFVAAERNAPASAWPYKRGRVARRLGASIGVLAVAAGTLVSWSGASSGQLSVVGLGCALVGVAVLAVVNAVAGPGRTRALPQSLSPSFGD
jgi:peptidoglycan/LPS O-acetylase OafA/YrhL